MYYEINVALNGRHFFATAERSVTSQSQLKKVYPTIKAAFPESEGYTVTVTKQSMIGESVDLVELEVNHVGT